MAMAKKAAGISDEAVAKATGKTWAEWLKVLDAAGAKIMSHWLSSRHARSYLPAHVGETAGLSATSTNAERAG